MNPDQVYQGILTHNAVIKRMGSAAKRYGVQPRLVPSLLSMSIKHHIDEGRA